MNIKEINNKNFWKQVFCNSENLFEIVSVEYNFKYELALLIKEIIHLDGCDNIFMNNEIVTIDLKKQEIKEVLEQKNVQIINYYQDISIAFNDIETYNKKNHITNLRKKFLQNHKNQH